MEEPSLIQLLQQRLRFSKRIQQADAAVLIAITQEQQPKVLLTRRSIHLSQHAGEVSFPGGKRDPSDTSNIVVALREAQEEAEAEVDIEQLYCMYNIPRIGQIYVLFKAQLKDGVFGAGEESLECRLFEEHDIPWAELAFPSVEQTLKHYFADRKLGLFPSHLETLGTRLDHTG